MAFLRWAGSKKQILGTVSQAWYASGATGRYIESFSGSAALFFYISPPKSILIDCNPHLQECMSVLKRRPIAVSTLLQRYSGDEAEYYKVRSTDPCLLSPEERSARFIYLNRFCFNGLYRTNSKGWFNVPYGGHKSGELPNADKLKYYSDILRNTTIVCGDFYTQTKKYVESGDFVYLDPPYAKTNASLDFQYGPNEFGMNDLDRLNELIKIIHSRGAYFVVSYAKCEEIEMLSEDWYQYPVEVRRTIAASPQKRQAAPELLITNL
ncbi:Dam family site-specific DNA-(adenine-N6)-methyltransferase [Rhodoferax sp.]|uniref:DNA adenine methylase n=1 Tax=Rhodoferax sp. TaxID=50421 RepID=UPI0025FA20E9|nr:Dam family site-specific DNA-(adenine-N6)-methyltransferase [Rhodoferax sp.]MCM2296600.1 Dam family site-specific DNA-(adenine-N6)-methyltransferase [Rhodoferax sp.]